MQKKLKKNFFGENIKIKEVNKKMIEKFNETQVRACYKFLQHEKESEIRVIDPTKFKKPESIFVHSEDEFVKECKKRNEKYNIYIGINERSSFGTNKSEVTSVKTIIIDIDAIKKKGFEKDPATEEELKLAEKDCDKILNKIEKVGFPKPVKLHSGNGFQIWIAIPKIEIDNANRNKIEEKLQLFQDTIKDKFQEYSSIDKIGDLPRIIKVWGTLNIKGNNTKERKHRVAKTIGNSKRNEDENTKKRIMDLKQEEFQSIQIEKIENLNEKYIPKPILFILNEYKNKNPDGWMRIVETLSSFFWGIGLEKEKALGQIINWCRKQPYKEKGEEKEVERIVSRIYKNNIMCPNFDKLIKKSQGYPYFGLKEIFINVDIGNDWKNFKNPVSFYKIKLKEDQNKDKGFLFSEFGNFTNFLKVGADFIKKQPLYYDDSKIWWAWNYKNYKWEIIDETDLMNALDKYTLNPSVNSKIKNELLEALKRVGRSNKPLPVKKTWVQFKDILIDIKTGEEFKANPKYFVANPIPWKLNQERFVNTPKMDEIFEEWVGKEYIQTLYEIIAYSLIPDYPIHRLFCFVGEGLNGKSCFLRLLQKFIGADNVTSTELDTLLSSRFEITRLHKKLICIMGETNFAEMNKTSIIKKLTGQDIIGFEYKNKNPFDDVNYAKILIATNNLPSTADKTVGFYRRWLIIDFPNRFSEQKDILKDIPQEEYEILAVKCLKILKDLLEKRAFTKEGSISEREKRYEEKSDPLEKFLKEFANFKDPEGSIPKWEFEKTLNEWLIENRHRKMADKTIVKKMREKGVEDGRVYVDWYEGDNKTKKQVRAWLGIKWGGKYKTGKT